MKRLFAMIVVVLGTIAMGFAQQTQTVDFGSLDPDSKAVFMSAAKAHPYGQTVKVEADRVLAIYTVTNVPSRSGRKMTQYLYILEVNGGQKQAVLLTDRPKKDECVCCWLSQCGGHQGDDPKFEEKKSSGENHIISTSYTPTDDDDDIVIE